MRRKISVLVTMIVMALIITACGKFVCDFCGEEKNGKSYESEVLGEEVVICQDCYDGIQELFGMN